MSSSPPDLTLWIFGFLFLVGCVAGIVDAISGGGGLLTVPSLMLAGLPPHLVLGTNKGQSMIGTAMALKKFLKTDFLDRERALKSLLPALLGSSLGVFAVLRIPHEILSFVIISLLTSIAVLMLFHRPHAHRGRPKKRGWLAISIVAFALAFYDGFFGPGTGIFLISAFVFFWNEPLHHASANAKAVNLASNVAACIVFAWKGALLWKFVVPMALGQAIGGYTGAHLTINRGPELVRVVVVTISLLIILRLAWGLFQ